MKRQPLDDSFKVNRNPVTLREIVLDKLRSAIMNFHLLPGDRLVERDLCDRLGVSRTSVREALRHLESEGLVEFADAKGPRVAIITLEDARDIYELRCVLEGLIVQLFTLNAKAKDIRPWSAPWRSTAKRWKKASCNRCSTRCKASTTCCSKAPATRWRPAVRQLQARISYLRATSVSQENRRGASNREMEKIVEAIKSGDPLVAHQASVDHVRAAAKVALDYLRQKQEDNAKVRDIVEPIALKEPA
jgi:DNA-binding GntR family transcriptional regulator